jgi:hypothetical protein
LFPGSLQILSFYDNKAPDDGKDASAITGIVGEDVAAGLMKHYFDSTGNSCEILNEKPTEGSKKGKWLDRWLKVHSDSTTVFYQTEIKNWCSHSIGGKQILITATGQEIIDYAHRKFYEEWDTDKETLRRHNVAKVLKTMRQPRSIDFNNGKIEPLICFWYPILDTSINSLIPFFCVDCKDNFEKVYFFSLSIYLRVLLKRGETVVDIEMPHFEQRIRKLQEMYDLGITQQTIFRLSAGNEELSAVALA